MIQTKADWLRSEIEKLESEKKMLSHDTLEMLGFRGREVLREIEVYNQALSSIITRYKEELKVLEDLTKE